MGKHDSRTTEEIIKDLGLTLNSVKDKSYNMTCVNGHKLVYTERRIRSGKATCNICDGRRLDTQNIQRELDRYGYIFVTGETSIDRCGNEVINASQRITVKCASQGHEIAAMCMSDIRRGKRCPHCSGSVRNNSYSRGEEIIAKVLDLNDIAYTRQEPITVITSEGVQTLRLDFFLPEMQTIIEYDGEHHKYGRSDGTREDLLALQKRDRIRDQYAKDNNLTMVRIPGGTIHGKAIVFRLFESLGDCVDLYLDSLYDTEIKAIFDHSAEAFNWNNYDYYRNIARLRLTGMELVDIQNIHGFRSTRVNKSFRTIYGVSYREYIGGKYSEFIN